jgi:hypothetical protein
MIMPQSEDDAHPVILGAERASNTAPELGSSKFPAGIVP